MTFLFLTYRGVVAVFANEHLLDMTVLFMRGVATKLALLTLMVAALSASLLITLKSLTNPSAAQEDAYVILLRHGDAPGRSEPRGFSLADCETQRSLSDKGRDEAQQVGELLRAQRIKVTKILTSRWCRARETAQLLQLGAMEDAPAFDNLEFNKQRAAELLDEERNLIESWHGPGVLLIVTHGSNIQALTGIHLEQGTMIVAKPQERNSVFLRFDKLFLQNTPSWFLSDATEMRKVPGQFLLVL